MSGVAHFFVVVGGSKIHERLAHFFIDIYSAQPAGQMIGGLYLRGVPQILCKHHGVVNIEQKLFVGVMARLPPLEFNIGREMWAYQRQRLIGRSVYFTPDLYRDHPGFCVNLHCGASILHHNGGCGTVVKAL